MFYRTLRILFLLSFLLLPLDLCAQTVSNISLIPQVRTLRVDSNSYFELNPKTRLVAGDKHSLAVAQLLGQIQGISLSQVSKGRNRANTIYLGIDTLLLRQSSTSQERYRLSISPQGIKLLGASRRGLLMGMQTLRQLLPPPNIGSETMSKGSIRLPALEIEDEPSFSYRGLMVDVARHFASVEEMKRHLDLMALFKLNVLHWHLTDDQGWRIEIKKYPRLTSIGSKRTPYHNANTDGYYTQAEVRELVAYAAARGIEIIPEIEMPGHSMAAIAAYPHLACNPRTLNGSVYRVRDIWDIETDVLCAGKDTTLDFLQDVIDEVAPLFPSKYFHVGGDECSKKRWKVCQHCQRRIRDKKLKDEHELQSYVILRAEGMLARHNKKLIGWDEILEGGKLTSSATIMSWRGEAGGIESANKGHDVVMTPGSSGLYIDHYQGDPKIEPVAWGGYSTLEQVYSYYPIPESISPERRKHILGAQANAWAEYTFTDSIRQYRIYPRILALSEALWSAREQRNFTSFCQRLDKLSVFLDAYGINYHIPLPEQPYGSCDRVAITAPSYLTLKTTRPIKMVYTLDGSTPSKDSQVYKAPILIDRSMTVKVASLMPSGKMSRVRSIHYDMQDYRPAVQLSSITRGLHTRTSVGDYQVPKDFVNATNWTDSIVPNLERVIPNKLSNNYDEFARKAVIAEGYIQVLSDDVYFVSSNYAEVWIDDEKIVDNGDEAKKNSRQDGSIALRAGFHKLRVVFVGATHWGYSSYWDKGKVQLRASNNPIWQDAVAYIEQKR